MHKLFPAHPKYDRCNQHQNAWETKGEMGAKLRIVQEKWAKPGRKDRTQVNGEIEPPENLGHQMLVPSTELVAYIRGDTGLYSASAYCDQA